MEPAGHTFLPSAPDTYVTAHDSTARAALGHAAAAATPVTRAVPRDPERYTTSTAPLHTECPRVPPSRTGRSPHQHTPQPTSRSPCQAPRGRAWVWRSTVHRAPHRHKGDSYTGYDHCQARLKSASVPESTRIQREYHGHSESTSEYLSVPKTSRYISLTYLLV